MKIYLFLSFLLFTCIIYGQNRKDSIINFIRNDSQKLGISLRKDSLQIPVYKLCERWYKEIDFLKRNLSNAEIANLENDENASLNIIALISKIQKNEKKSFVKEILEEEINRNSHKLFSKNCSDAISILPKELFLLELIQNKNFFLSINFKLSKKELQNYRNQILLKYSNFPH